LPDRDDLAAIIFTTGSTGPPKGVRYEHSIFSAQLRHIKNYYAIGAGDIDQPAFPLFALFSTALGACAVIPDMDPTKPARVNPKKFIHSIIRYNVTYSFGSPALWNVVSRYCLSRHITLSSVQKVLMAGAPVSGELLERVRKILPAEAELHTPYGATESLPIVSIEAEEVVGETWRKTQQGHGTCVGRALPGIEIKILKISDEEIPEVKENMILGTGNIGEIIVSGDVVTRAYDNNAKETRLAKTQYKDKLWHRMGDTGFLDAKGRLWFCGRKAHRIETQNGTKFSVRCEAIVNNHPDIFRSALVGVGSEKTKLPVLVLEKEKSSKRSKREILEEVKSIAGKSILTDDIAHFLFHDDFPVDIRHNAKIFREKLAVWATAQLADKR
jgi:acyl-CoA synthetase (AMP-forming)/AMP-acid ligase II